MKKHAKKIVTVLLVAAMLVPTVAMMFGSAAISTTYPVELGFENLFSFSDWASNQNSTKVVGVTTGKLEANVATGSFTMTKSEATPGDNHEVYTGHGMDKENAISNMDYYIMTIEPNTTYSFSYYFDAANSTAAATNFFVNLFFFDSDNLCKTFTDKIWAKNAGDNTILFTTPAGVTKFQIRFGIFNAGAPKATISNISLTKCDVVTDSANLFDFDAWYGSSSGQTVGTVVPVDEQGNTITTYNDGNVTPTSSDKSILMELNEGGGMLFTGSSLASTAGYYMIPVNASSQYILSYNLVNTMGRDFKEFVPYVIKVSTSGVISYSDLMGASGYGAGSCVFTTDADTEYISPVFTVSGSDEWFVTVKDIKLMAAEIDENKHTPHRLVKTYGEDETYGTLPTLTAPEGYVFAGWCTSEDGSGEVITATTPVQPLSLTVYPKFELAVDTLTVKTGPDKKIYTAGEKLDTTGLVLEATVTRTITTESDENNNGIIEDNEITTETITSTIEISSGYSINPKYAQTSAGTQAITVSYGGKTTSFNITVKDSDPGTVIINGVSTEVPIANKEYTFNLTGLSFNRYEVTYKSDSYVSGVATFNDGKTEDFFLEPSENGSFGSYINKFLEDNKYTELVKIKFTTLDKEFGNFELISLNTVSVADPGDTVFFSNHKFEMGIALNSGGAVSELYDISEDIYARTYTDSHYFGDGDDRGTKTLPRTQVDYKNKLDENYGTSGYSEESKRVNLINTLDKGRYLQQSYYGSGEHPYVQSEYNNAAWPYNPVQGGNVVKEGSKIIDYKIADTYVYVKARPLDWAKWSDEYVDPEEREIYDEISWGDDYITDTYVEAWYYFQGDTIKVVNRKVDYSGLADAVHSQEFPALYLIEPLNHFVYNNVSEENAWASDSLPTQQNIPYARETSWNVTHQDGKLINVEEPEFWGITQEYIDKFEMDGFKSWVSCNENWAAFTASEDADSFGVGIYTDVTDRFYYGVQPAVHEMSAGDMEGSVGGILESYAYRHAQTVTPSPELPTSYIAPTGSMTFRSYEPTEFTYYLATGTAEKIREDFKAIADGSAEAESGKPKIAVPETVYLNPANNKDGQYYANNILNPNNYYNIETEAEYTDMYLGVYTQNGHSHISVNVENVDDPLNDVDVCLSVTPYTSFDDQIFGFNEDTDPNDGTFIFPSGLDLDFDSDAAGLQPGETATVKWTITTYSSDPRTTDNYTTEVYTAYTVMYAPHRTVGAVAEARQVNASQHELASWITGSNGIDHSQRAPLGSFKGDVHDSGYFREDPLVDPDTAMNGYNPGGGNSHDYIISSDESSLQDGGVNQSDDYSENAYVLQTATDDHDSSRAQSYLGLLAIDKSRYTNTDQIPNLRIGWDALRIGSLKNNSLGVYKTYYTVGTNTAYTATSLSEAPSGWTQNSSHTDIAGDGGKSLPYRETLVPSYTVSGLDGKYLHAIAQGEADQLINTNQYATAGTSVLIDVTDKSALRDSVTDAYGVTDPSEEFLEKLEEAATILGTPGASQEDIDRVNDALNEDLEELLNKVYALKYDNLFSAYEWSQFPNSMAMSQPNKSSSSYENGKITIVNEELGTRLDTNTNQYVPITETYTKYAGTDDYYKVTLNPDTEYVFEYDVTTSAAAQAFMFFYNSSNGSGDKPTNIQKKVNDGAWSGPSNNEQNPWWGHYISSAGTYHCIIKFTTGPNTTQASFRFGNTINGECTSTFSNIRLVDSAHYYEDAVYSATETTHKEYTAYGALQIPTRLGYAFDGWVYADGTAVTGSDVAVDHESIYSVWSIINYTITYNANGGSVTPASQDYTVKDTVTLPTPTREGYIFQGWKVTAASGSWAEDGICPAGEIPVTMHGNAVLTAQWVLGEISVYFDSILDFDKWNTTTASNATFSNVTGNGFTLTSNSGAGEGTSESPEFPVTAGKQYYIDIDFAGNGWDVYIFFRSETVGSTGIDFTDSGNRFSSNGGGNQTRIFTAPEGATKAVIRLDANGSSNSVTFSDIRVYEAGTCAPNVDVPYTNNRNLTYGSTFGTLPVPTREGYEFLGWYDENGIKVTAESTVNYASNVYLKSKWQITNDVLVKDNVVIDFSTPIEIKPLTNDTAYANAQAASFLGFSADGTTPGATTINGTYGKFTVSGETVTYTPAKTVDGVEKIYYHASITDENGEHSIKNEITVAPASNILYEDTFFEGNTDLTGLPGIAWTDIKSTGLSTSDTANQNSSPIADEKYGYDSNEKGYNQFATYSNGTAKTVMVSADASKMMSKNLTFTFNGTGFDLNSACGANTGVMIVSVKNNDTNAMVKSYVVDTYYGDANYGLASSSNTLYQVPIISETLDSYANYTVQVVASWLPSMSGAISADKAKEAEEQQKLQQASVNGLEATVASGADNEALRNALAELGLDYIFDAEEVEVVWFDDNSVLNGGMGADTPVASDKLETAALDGLVNVIDSVRVYNPLNGNNDYYIDSEKNAVYHNVINNLLKTEGSSLTNSSFFAYITGKLGVDEEGNDIQLTVSNYESVGPKNELYLSESTQAVAFKVNDFSTIKSIGGRVMISLRAASGTPKLKIGGTDFSVNSNTEMYYDITNYISEDGTVTFQNRKDLDTDKSLLAIGSLKITCPVSMQAASISSDVDLETVRMMMMAPSETVEPNTTPTPEEPEVPEEPEDPDEPEIPEEPAEESWLIRIFKWIFNTVIKIFSALKGFLAI